MAQQIISGLEAGTWYSLMALAIVLVLRTTGVFNFAIAEMGLISAFVLYSLTADAHIGYPIAVVLTLVFAFAFGVVIERVFIRPIFTKPLLATEAMTIGLYIGLNSLVVPIWGPIVHIIQTGWSERTIVVATETISLDQVVTFAVAMFLLGFLLVFFRTDWGIRMRAVAEDRITPRLLGVSSGRTFSLAWGLSSVLACVAVVLQTQATLLASDSAQNLLIEGFVAAALGGFASLPGAVLGGLLIGVLENLAGAYISTGFKSAVALVIVVAVLTLRREGIVARQSLRDV
jgi:branched-chain amino acid transport system permease protein